MQLVDAAARATPTLSVPLHPNEIPAKEFTPAELVLIKSNMQQIWNTCIRIAPSLVSIIDDAMQDRVLYMELEEYVFQGKDVSKITQEQKDNEVRAYMNMLVAAMCITTSLGVAIRLLKYDLYGSIRGMVYPLALIMLSGRGKHEEKFQTTVLCNIVMTSCFTMYPTKPLVGVMQILSMFEMDHQQMFDVMNNSLHKLQQLKINMH